MSTPQRVGVQNEKQLQPSGSSPGRHEWRRWERSGTVQQQPSSPTSQMRQPVAHTPPPPDTHTHTHQKAHTGWLEASISV